MKVKVEKVAVGLYDYDSIFVKIEGKDTEIVFGKSEKVSQYDGREVELMCDKGIYKIKPITSSK